MRVSIVGCGNIANTHVSSIIKLKDVQLIAVCDRDEVRAHDFGGRYAVPFFTEFERMLAETRPQAVHILTPPHTHALLAVQALKAGCHVLVEKPLCLTMEDAENIYRVADSAGRMVSVDHTLLWSPLVQKAQQALASGRLGRILTIKYVIGDDYLEMVRFGYARWALELKGGVFCDLIPHQLYLIRSFLPDVRVFSARACGTNIRDLHELWVDFVSAGAGVELWMSLNQRPLEHSLRIYCTQGVIHLDLRNFSLAVVPETGLPGPVARIVNTISESWQRGTGTMWNAAGVVLGWFKPRAGTEGAIKAFYNAITEGKPVPVSPDDAKATVALSNAIWNLLEKTPGAIQPAVNLHGKAIIHKTPADFTKKSGSEPPTVLVTGGTGFIGGHLVRRLVSIGRRVRVFCRKDSSLDGLSADGIELEFGDISDNKAVRQAMRGIKVVYHLAATIGGDWADHYHGTIEGTRNVLGAAEDSGVEKLVYLSSMGVLNASSYPVWRTIDESFTIEQHPEARGDYSRAKLEAERMVLDFAKRKKPAICILRPGLVYGPGRKAFLPDAGFTVSKGMALVVGLGGRRMGLTYVENLVDALVLAEEKELPQGKLFNIVDPAPPTVRKYIHSFNAVSKTKIIPLYVPVWFWMLGFALIDGMLRLFSGRKSHFCYRLRSMSRSLRCDTSAAQKELGWQARFSFEQGMANTYGEGNKP